MRPAARTSWDGCSRRGAAGSKPSASIGLYLDSDACHPRRFGDETRLAAFLGRSKSCCGRPASPAATATRQTNPLASETSLNECCGRLLHVILGLLVGEPLSQLRHPVVERHARLVPQLLPRE